MKKFHSACVVEDLWHAEAAPLLPRVEEEILPNRIQVAARSEACFDFNFDAIYAGFVTLKVHAKGLLRADVICLETENSSGEEHFVFDKDTSYVGLQLRSIGRYQLKVQNESDFAAEIVLSVTVTHYPVLSCARTVTSDAALNAVFKQCEHALKHCRQMIHLDSPLHSEPLACTGDYYIESLMTAFSFGDFSLAAFDVIRTGEMLKYQKGVMFHTTYSLIWVLWLYDVYLYTGDQTLLEQCAEALQILLERFRSYLGETGLIETPPSYMFIDWLYIDDISLHHPPKALGQSCLNMFYYAALKKAEQIWRVLGKIEAAVSCEEDAVKLRTSINLHLFDKERGLYHEGLNTDTPAELLAKYMPANVSKRYYRKHANVLAVYSGVCEGDAAELLERVLKDDSLGEFQPYFAHFVLEAVNRMGLQDKLLLPLLEPWKKAYQECPKGLQEGFIKPEPTYAFDHSHAWGGTPLYAVPLALSGLQILEPGMKKIRLNPQLLGLAWADVEIPTPYGLIQLKLQQGKEAQFVVPEAIELVK